MDFLVIGHVTRDLQQNDPASDDYTLGGTVSFAAVTATRLGRHATVVTRAGPDVDLALLREIADLRLLPASHTTTFVNLYTATGRVQYCYHPAPPITAAEITADLRGPNVVLCGPLVREIGPEILTLFDDDTLVAAVPQGWMRRWDDSGLVHASPWQDAEHFLPHLDVLILSIEDINYDLSRLEPFFRHVPLVVMTEYRDGSTVYCSRDGGSPSVVKVPPRPANEVDPTGAGDTFATAFLLRLQEIGDPIQAARYANVVASFGVEGVGVAGIPSHEEVLAYMDEHPWQGEECL